MPIQLSHPFDDTVISTQEKSFLRNLQANILKGHGREHVALFFLEVTDPPKARDNDPTPIHAGFALAHFNGDTALEAKIKDDLKVTVRCVPLDPALGGEPGTCPFTGQPSKQRVVWAKSY